MSGFSVTYTPITSLNDNSGSVTMGYFPYSSVKYLESGNTVEFYGGSPIGTNAISQG